MEKLLSENKIFLGVGNDVKTSISKFGLEPMISNIFIYILVIKIDKKGIFDLKCSMSHSVHEQPKNRLKLTFHA